MYTTIVCLHRVLIKGSHRRLGVSNQWLNTMPRDKRNDSNKSVRGGLLFAFRPYDRNYDMVSYNKNTFKTITIMQVQIHNDKKDKVC